MELLSRLYAAQYRTRILLAGTLRRLRGSADATHFTAPSNVLFVIAGLLGDSVMCTPVLTEARRLWPKAKFTVLGKKANSELLGDLPVIDEFLIVPAFPFALRKWRELRQLDSMLKGGNFDLAIILLGDQFAPALERAVIPVRVGVAGDPLAPFLTHTYEIRSPREWGPDERLNALRVLGCEVGAASPMLQTNASAVQSAHNIRRECGTKRDAYAVIHPFGSSALQHWPLAGVQELATELWQRHGLEAVLIGGPEWCGVSESIGDAVVNTVGRLKLPELMAMIQEAKLVITTDSGPFHIAGALSRPTVGLFRKSRPEHARRYSPAEVVLGQHPSCTNCKWNWCRVRPCASMRSICVTDIME